MTDEELVRLAGLLGMTLAHSATWGDEYVGPMGYELGSGMDDEMLHPIAWLTTWEGAGAVQSAMAALGFGMVLRVERGTASCELTSWRRLMPDRSGRAEADTAPEAVARAALAALGGAQSDQT